MVERIRQIGLPSDLQRVRELRAFMRSILNLPSSFYGSRETIPRSDDILLALIKEWSEEFDVIFLPLTFRYFGSLRICELIHNSNVNLKTIAYSASRELDDELATPLFDSYINTSSFNASTFVASSGFNPDRAENIKEENIYITIPMAIHNARANACRIIGKEKLDVMIGSLISTQGCFRYDPIPGRHPELSFQATLSDYKNRIYLEDFMSAFPNGADASKIETWRQSHVQVFSINSPSAQIYLGSADNHQITTQDIKMRDRVDVANYGQIGAVGSESKVEGNILSQQLTQSQRNIDLQILANELSSLRNALRGVASTVEEDQCLAKLGAAEKAAKENDRSAVFKHLKEAGQWALDVATKIGTSVAAKAIEDSLLN